MKKLLPGKTPGILAFLFIFVFCGVHRSIGCDGDDLSASYIGARLLATGHASHLYSHDPRNFSAIGPDLVWQQAADSGQYEAFLHPYVQTPLWAWSLQPLARLPWPVFHNIFAVLTLLSFAACIWIVARFWAPELFNPAAIALICLSLWFFEPFQYAIQLMQTHVFFLLLTLLALILAERNRPIAAGILLACAAAVKITPGALLLYWLLTRRWKAVASMAVTSAVLWVAAYLAVGPHVMAAYLDDLHRVSQVLLVSQNNQSFAAWTMARFYPRKEIFGFQVLPLPAAVRLASSALFLACTVAGGLLDASRCTRCKSPGTGPCGTFNPDPAPLGAMLALVAATIFAPISWTHYSIILIAPLMVLVHELLVMLHDSRSRESVARKHALRKSKVREAEVPASGPDKRLPDSRPVAKALLASILLITALNFQPVAAGAEATKIHRLTLVRSHFYSELLCLVTLAATAAWLRDRSEESGGGKATERMREQVYS